MILFSSILWLLWKTFTERDFVILLDVFSCLIILFLNRIKNVKIYNLLIGFSLVITFGTVLISPDVTNYLLFICYMIFVALALNSSDLYNNSESYYDKKLTLNIKYFKFLIKSTPLGIICALCIFIVFPRISQIKVKLPFAVKNRFQTGYTGSINFEELGQSNLDNSKVLQISSPNNNWLRVNFQNLYLKGSTLEEFDGKRWYSKTKENKLYLISSPTGDVKNINLKSFVVLDTITSSLYNKVVFLADGFFTLSNISSSVKKLYFNPENSTMIRDTDDPVRFSYRTKIIQKKQHLKQP